MMDFGALHRAPKPPRIATAPSIVRNPAKTDDARKSNTARRVSPGPKTISLDSHECTAFRIVSVALVSSMRNIAARVARSTTTESVDGLCAVTVNVR